MITTEDLPDLRILALKMNFFVDPWSPILQSASLSLYLRESHLFYFLVKILVYAYPIGFHVIWTVARVWLQYLF